MLNSKFTCSSSSTSHFSLNIQILDSRTVSRNNLEGEEELKPLKFHPGFLFIFLFYVCIHDEHIYIYMKDLIILMIMRERESGKTGDKLSILGYI